MDKKLEAGKGRYTQEQFVRLRVKEFDIPPIKDGVVVGKRSPIGAEALQRCLTLLCPDGFERLHVQNDDIIEEVFLRATILRKVPAEKMLDLIERTLKPLMADTEVLILDVDLEVVIESRI